MYLRNVTRGYKFISFRKHSHAAWSVSYGTNGNLGIQEDELLTWLDDQVVFGFCELYPEGDPLWVFDIADPVVYGWDYQNNGSKLVHIRLYPMENLP